MPLNALKRGLAIVIAAVFIPLAAPAAFAADTPTAAHVHKTPAPRRAATKSRPASTKNAPIGRRRHESAVTSKDTKPDAHASVPIAMTKPLDVPKIDPKKDAATLSKANKADGKRMEGRKREARKSESKKSSPKKSDAVAPAGPETAFAASLTTPLATPLSASAANAPSTPETTSAATSLPRLPATEANARAALTIDGKMRHRKGARA